MKNLLLCPICGEALSRVDRQWRCSKNHSFDIARQGYVNLLPVTQKHSAHPGDTRDMVAARKAFLDRGYYAPIAEKVAQMLLPLLPDAPAVLDAGCGEGYYMTALQEKCPGDGTFIGVDISKDAVRYAAGRNKNALWLTASAAHLPLRSETFDGVMSMFALTVPGEFARVLKPGGYFLEVTAGREHLMGLKSIIYPTLTEKAEKTDTEYPGFTLISSETPEFSFSLHTAEEVGWLLSMTPHFWRISKDGAARLSATESLDDRAQVLFRLYQKD